MKRRILLKGTAASASLVAAAVAGLLVPVRLLAADWPQTAFESDDAETCYMRQRSTADVARTRLSYDPDDQGWKPRVNDSRVNSNPTREERGACLVWSACIDIQPSTSTRDFDPCC